MKRASHRRTRALAVLSVLLSAGLFGLLLGGCGDSDEVAPPPNYAKTLAGSPAPLTALHDQSNQLLDGGLDAYEDRLSELEGFPVVTNVWASWCGPCRNEFPMIQRAAAKQGKKVAFLGVNSKDGEDFASDFLSEFPVPFPSYLDPDGKIAKDLGAIYGYPATAFYDESGELTQVKHGEFRDQQELDFYIERYATAD